jgi:acyl carrier protein
MLNSSSGSGFSKEAILKEVTIIVRAMFPELEEGFSGSIKPESRLIADLGFESINLVQFAEAVEKHFNTSQLPFQELFLQEDVVIEDLKILDAVEFLYTNLKKR